MWSTSSPSGASPIAFACDVVLVGFPVQSANEIAHRQYQTSCIYLNNSASFILFVCSSWISTCQIQSGTFCNRTFFRQFLRTCRGTRSQEVSGSPARFCSVTSSPATSSKDNLLSRRHQKRNSTTLEDLVTMSHHEICGRCAS